MQWTGEVDAHSFYFRDRNTASGASSSMCNPAGASTAPSLAPMTTAHASHVGHRTDPASGSATSPYVGMPER